MKRLAIVSLVVLLLLFSGVKTQSERAFFNGQIHTMNAQGQVVEAMLVVNGRIAQLGTSSTIKQNASPGTALIDLQGRTVVPGFIDAHSHFPASGIRAVSVDLSPPPIGDIDSHAGLLARLQRAAKNDTNDEWLLGYNYDNTAFRDGLHPSRAELDALFPDRAVYLWHNSGHMGVANSSALALLSITEESKPPAGGAYGRDLSTGKLNGLLLENAAPPLANIVKQYSLRKQLNILSAARDEYLAAGVTTVQNGFAGKNMMRVLRWAQFIGLIPQRVVVWPAEKKMRNNIQFQQQDASQFTYRVGALKLIVDGSPQGMTAFLSEPYFAAPRRPEHYRGFALMGQQALTERVAKYHRAGHQLALHGNGDAAIDMIINAVEHAQSLHPRTDARHIIVHAQVLRKDQVAKLAALHLTPSFFTSHTYFWGDWHRLHSLGPERANNISPAHWAQDAGVKFSQHTDAPVTPMSPQQMLWSATQRLTQTGFLLGEQQRIDMHSALRAITIDAAWQNHIEAAVGSLETGKFADLVVLSQSPFEADDVRDIQVLQTYINGVKRFDRLSQQHID